MAAARFMTEEYERFPSLPGAQTAVRQVISMLADERPVIAHCFAGKDRTGFTVALVLETVGVHRDAIVADFLRSNDAVPQLRERILESIRNRAEETTTPEIVTFAEARLTDEVLGVREEYLAAAKRTIDAEYGSTAGYLEALGVTADQVSRLRQALAHLALGHLDVGDQDADAAGGQLTQRLEEGAGLRRGDGHAGGVVVRVVQVDHPVRRGR